MNHQNFIFLAFLLLFSIYQVSSLKESKSSDEYINSSEEFQELIDSPEFEDYIVEKELDEIEGLLDRMEDLHGKGEPFEKEEAVFHGAVVRAGGNRVAAQIAVRCPTCGDVSYGLSSGEDAAGILRELREVVQCMKEHDPGGARAAMRLHLLRSFQSEGVD